MQKFNESFQKLDHDALSLDELWLLFRNELNTATMNFVPHKIFRSKKLPWITQNFIRLMHKRDKLHIKVKKGQIALTQKYKLLKSKIKREMRKAYWKYIDSIISYNPDDGPADARSKNKKFWSFVASRKKDNVVIPPLKSFGTLFPESADKANLLNLQFKSAFSMACPLSLKNLCSSVITKILPTNVSLSDNHSNVTVNSKPDYQYKMPKIIVTVNGISKLLKEINPFKACGPDQIKPKVLKELHMEIAPILQIIFVKSLQLGTVPADWRNANVAPIYKKRVQNRLQKSTAPSH